MAGQKKYRFFYHYYKQKDMMTVHFRGKCHTVKEVVCKAPCETKWKATQPKLVMQGWATDVVIDSLKAVIQ